MKNETDVSAGKVRLNYDDLRHLAVIGVFAKLRQIKDVVGELEPDLISIKNTKALSDYTRHAYVSLENRENLLGDYKRMCETAHAVLCAESRDEIKVVK